MSYILEALQKSEYTRQQGRVPDLATLPRLDAGAQDASMRQHLPVLAAGAVLLAVAAAGWWRPWQTPSEPPREMTPAVVPAVATVTSAAPAPIITPAPRQTASPLATPAAVVEATPPAAVSSSTAVPVALAPALAAPATPIATAAASEARRETAVLPALPQAPISPAPYATAATSMASDPTPAAPAALPPPPKGVLGFYELPPVVRERLPALRMSGFSYTNEPDMRMAVINDRVLRQGESAAPGITLERINSDGVVLNFNGYRFKPQR